MRVQTPFVYVAVAAICILLHNAVLIVGDFLGLPLWAGILTSFTLVASVGYVLHGLFTFRQPLAFSRFAKYVIAMSANVPVAFVTTWFWKDLVGLPMVLAAPLASACMLVLNFLLGRWAITAPSDHEIVSR